MSNNAQDYENNLVFESKSADDLNKQERQSDVLISAIERCEMLEKKLEIAVKSLITYKNLRYDVTVAVKDDDEAMEIVNNLLM